MLGIEVWGLGNRSSAGPNSQVRIEANLILLIVSRLRLLHKPGKKQTDHLALLLYIPEPSTALVGTQRNVQYDPDSDGKASRILGITKPTFIWGPETQRGTHSGSQMFVLNTSK